jgi:phosphopantothenoylcysteine decarboxylase / phosphopantothenate---cysteine ligase
MKPLTDKHILLGVTGGIAAYKSAELVRRLRDAGADVRVVMTEAATRFVTPLTFQALSGNPVHLELLDPAAEAAMGHIELARWADLVLVAPASADFMARVAHGLANDLLSTLCLATEAPLVLAPAMNRCMWEHPATQANRRALAGRGVHLEGPGDGGQACGETGPGRMLEPAVLVERAEALLAPGVLAGLRVLITAGPTREPIDPVRFIGNRSSGKMGFAVAAAARDAGAEVTLVSGPVGLAAPSGVACVRVETAQEMHDRVLERVGGCDILVAAAAVADYRPTASADQKIKKMRDRLELALERTPDVLAAVAKHPRRPFLVGFAAETEHLAEHARAKLQAKGVDLVAANWVGRPGTGFEADDNALLLLWQGGQHELPRASKVELARELIRHIAERYHDKNPAEDP